MKNYFVYIVASKKNGTIYVGVTNDLVRRVVEHKTKQVKGFTEKHGVDILVWHEQTKSIQGAIIREKHIKKWNRKWKIREIEKNNPEWKDLFYDIGGSEEMLKAVTDQLSSCKTKTKLSPNAKELTYPSVSVRDPKLMNP